MIITEPNASLDKQVTLAKALAQQAIWSKVAALSASDGMSRLQDIANMLAAIGAISLLHMAITLDEPELTVLARKLTAS